MKTISRDELKSLLEKDIPDITNKEIWIWGVGSAEQLYTEAFNRIKNKGFVISGYCDSNPQKWKDSDVRIVAPSTLRNKQNICVIISSQKQKNIDEIGKECDSMNLEWYLLEETLLKVYHNEVLQCYDILEDKESQNLYANIIVNRMIRDFKDISVDEEQYFALPPFKKINAQEVFVDCGAYVGDSVEKYIWEKTGIFKKIIAFEPDQGNFKAMETRIERLKKEWNISDERITLVPCGVGEKNKSGVFTSAKSGSGFFSAINETEMSCGIVSLDEFIKEPYSFLKADIEGYEYNMIKGAEKGIIVNHPMMAITIYHNVVDLYSVPLLIKEMVPEYHIAIRHHTDTFMETVVYAWTDNF